MEGSTSMSLINRYYLIKMLKEYKEIIQKYEISDYSINYKNMVLNLIELLGV
jgi:hypothetical protein